MNFANSGLTDLPLTSEASRPLVQRIKIEHVERCLRLGRIDDAREFYNDLVADGVDVSKIKSPPDAAGVTPAFANDNADDEDDEEEDEAADDEDDEEPVVADGMRLCRRLLRLGKQADFHICPGADELPDLHLLRLEAAETGDDGIAVAQTGKTDVLQAQAAKVSVKDALGLAEATAFAAAKRVKFLFKDKFTRVQ